MAVGFTVKKLGIVSNEGQKNLTDLVLYLILPCNIVKSFVLPFSKETLHSCVLMLLLGLGIQGFSILYGKLLYRGKAEGRRKCLQYGIICSNSGFLGNPIAEGLYGAQGLMLASVFLIPLRILMWSFGLAVFSGTTDHRATLKKVVTHPCILACVLGVLLMVTQKQLPSLFTKVITYIGQCNTALSMMVIGMILTGIDFKHLADKDVLVYTLHRLLVIPAIVYAVCLLLPIGATERGLSVILTAMPAGATTSILASKYHMEPEFGTKLVVFSTLCSVGSIFLWSLIVR